MNCSCSQLAGSNERCGAAGVVGGRRALAKLSVLPSLQCSSAVRGLFLMCVTQCFLVTFGSLFSFPKLVDSCVCCLCPCRLDGNGLDGNKNMQAVIENEEAGKASKCSTFWLGGYFLFRKD
jgi:hypothetical protein